MCWISRKPTPNTIPDRYYTSIVRFLGSLPGKKKIQIEATDMWRPYRLAVLRVLPKAKQVVDTVAAQGEATATYARALACLRAGMQDLTPVLPRPPHHAS